MNLTQFNPWWPFERAWPEGAVSSPESWTPAVDIQETEDSFVLRADIPGVEPDRIEVAAENGLLTIKGDRQSETTDAGENYTRTERSYGSFARSFRLPDTVDTSGIKATGKHGVLEVVLPKKEVMQARRIPVTH